MEHLPPELISHVMRFLSVSDRKEAALVCKTWYNASLDPILERDIIVKCRPPGKGSLPPMGLLRRKLTHLDLGDWDSQLISEENFVSLLSRCPNLVELDLSCCNNLFLSGRLLKRENDRATLKQSLVGVRKLKLGCLRHMTDITFSRLVSVMENVERISLASTNMIYGSGLYDVNQSSHAMLHFSTFLKYVKERAHRLKHVDLSYTAVHDKALESLAKTEGLALSEIWLQGCMEISDKGLKMLVSQQPSLQILDISGCRDLGTGKLFFSTLANNLPRLHTLIMRKCVKVGQCDVHSLADMGSLRTLDIGEVLNLFDRDLIKGLCCKTPRLTSLSLPFCPDLNDAFVILLCKTNPHLTHLDLSSCLKLTDSSLHAITRTLVSLRLLKLRYCRELTDIGLLGFVPENGVVTRHCFEHDHDGCPCTRERESKIFCKPTGKIEEHRSVVSKAQTSLENGEEMHMLSNLEHLQVLDLSSCYRITDLSLSEVVKFRELRSLSLSALPKIEDKAIIAIARHNPSLEEVNLMGNSSITDTAIVELVTHCPRLRRLDVSQCFALTDSCLWSVIPKARWLRHLDVSFCNMSVEAVTALENHMPSLKVIFRPHTY